MAQTLSVPEMLPAKVMPHLKNRFVLAIEGIDAYMIKTAARPEITTEEIKLNWINSTRYVAGKTEFGEMSVTLIDYISPSTAQQVMEWARLCYEPVSGRAGYPDFYKRDIQLKILDPVGTVVQLWDYKGAWCKSINYGELSMEEGNAVQEITLGIRYDMVVQQF